MREGTPYSYFPKLVDVYPDGHSHGKWRISHKEITEETVKRERLRAIMSYGSNFGLYDLKPGSYVVLRNGGTIWMSDTPFERRTNTVAYRFATGDTLLLGLGLAMLPMGLIDRQMESPPRYGSISSLTIIEYSQDVIDLVKPVLLAYSEERGNPFPITIIHGNAYTPERIPELHSRKFDYIWSDIWDTYGSDMWPEIVALRRVWKKHRKEEGIHHAWVETWAQYQAKKEGNPATSEAVREVLNRHRTDLHERETA